MNDLLADEIRREGAILGRIVQYCTEEVVRQRADPDAVRWMLGAWLAALKAFRRAPLGALLESRQIESLGRLLEPTKNATGYRDCDVRVGSRLCPAHDQVRSLMETFCAEMGKMTPEEAYHRFELLHPFRDANGRAGKIIYNWLRGTLDNPTMPPNFFGVANP